MKFLVTDNMKQTLSCRILPSSFTWAQEIKSSVVQLVAGVFLKCLKLMRNLPNLCMQTQICTMLFSSHQLQAATLNEVKLKFNPQKVHMVSTLDSAGKDAPLHHGQDCWAVPHR